MKLPKQRLSFSKKVEKDYKWAKQTIDYILGKSYNGYKASRASKDYVRMVSNYQLFNNELNQADFEKECNPMNISAGQFKDQIQPYNKTYNKIQALLTDELLRPFTYRPILINADGVKSKMEYKDQLLRQYVLSQLQMGEETEMDPKKVEEYMATTYLEAREISGAKVLNLLKNDLSIPSLKNDSFKHALISGYEFAYVGELNGKPHLEVLNPPGVFYHKSPETKYVQDGQYAGYSTYMTASEIFDRFGRYLSEEDKEKIDQSNTPGLIYEVGAASNANALVSGSYATAETRSTDYLVQHVEWRSQRKIGFLNFINEFGDEETQIVSEDFTLPKPYTTRTVTKEFNVKCTYYDFEIDGNQFTLTWDWIPEVWTGVRIGTDVYCMIGPKKNQYRRLDDPTDVKLGYHGLAYSSMNADPVSLMDRMKPFQYLYFIIMHKLKQLIATDVGTIYQFDSSMVDPNLGYEKTMYYLRELKINVYNSLQNADFPGASQRSSVAGSVEWSHMQHILNYVALLGAIDQQISDVAGVSRQREGQILPTEAVTNAQSAAQMSSLVTETYFFTHDKYWEQVLDSLLQVAMECYRDKKVLRQYVLDDMTTALLEITPGELNNADFAVFVSNSPKDNQLFEALKANAAELMRTGMAKFSDIISLYEVSSVQELKNRIIAAEKTAERLQQEQQQQEIQAQQQVQQMKSDTEMEIAVMNNETKIKVAEIQSFSFQKDQDVNDNQVPDQLEIQKLRANIELKNRELDIKDRQVDVQEKAIAARNKAKPKS